jgi:hypothetical protein
VSIVEASTSGVDCSVGSIVGGSVSVDKSSPVAGPSIDVSPSDVGSSFVMDVELLRSVCFNFKAI